MIHFPVLQRIQVDGYDMYPGETTGDGLALDLNSDLSVIVGTNGLGKSTLLTIAFRLLTGPVDIPGAATDGELGSARLEFRRLRSADLREFAARVLDGADKATATLQFALGSHELTITRSLKDLRLVAWQYNGNQIGSNESELQAALSEACGVWSFSDWLLILRYVTFYMDDRQVLFWDRSAQRQLLRSLFLSPEDAKEWVTLEREVLEQDSKFRNFRNVLNNEQRRLATLIAPDSPAHISLRDELTRLLEADDADAVNQELLNSVISELNETRANKNLERLQARQRLDELSRSYEHAKLVTLAAQFPSESDSALFIWNQILAENECLLCGSAVPHFKHALEKRIRDHKCVVCDSALPLNNALPDEPIEINQERSERAWADLEQQRADLNALELQYAEIVESFDEARSKSAHLELKRTVQAQRINVLNSQLPADTDGYHSDRTQLSSLQARLDAMAGELETLAANFDNFVEEKTASILVRADDIKARFDYYSNLFLLGQGELTWSPREEQVGQSSYKIKFPAYELQLSRNGTSAVSTRSGVGDVSESQKEFIDLAFRMALIDTAGQQGGATLIIDTPESSLDAVFTDRAASVLADFASTEGSTLVVASNLTDGRLVPRLVKRVRDHGASYSLTNLLDLARPTPAVLELGQEYKEAYGRLLEDVQREGAK